MALPGIRSRDGYSIDGLPWFMMPARVEPMLRRAPDEATRTLARSFLRDGYVVIPASVSQADCDAAVAAFRRLEARNAALFAPHLDADGHYGRIVNLHLASQELRRLFSRNTAALALQDFLFQAETSLYTSLFYERGSAQDIHRDTPYFCTRPEYRYLGVWVALEDVDEDNGPLMVVPGGHAIPELDREALAAELFGEAELAPAHSDDLWITYQTRVADSARRASLEIKTVPVKQGSTILWHPQLPHGGAAIRNMARTRFSVVMHTTPLGVPVYHQDAFFNPRRPFPLTAPWPYVAEDGRRYAHHATISFNHQQDHGVEALAH